MRTSGRCQPNTRATGKAAQPGKPSARRTGVNPTPASYNIVPYQSTHNVGGAVMGPIRQPARSTNICNRGMCRMCSWSAARSRRIPPTLLPRPSERVGLLGGRLDPTGLETAGRHDVSMPRRPHRGPGAESLQEAAPNPLSCRAPRTGILRTRSTTRRAAMQVCAKRGLTWNPSRVIMQRMMWTKRWSFAAKVDGRFTGRAANRNRASALCWSCGRSGTWP